MDTCQKGEVDENEQRLGASGSALGPRSAPPLAPVPTQAAVVLHTSATLGQRHGTAAAAAQARASPAAARHRRHRRLRSTVNARRTVLARPRDCDCYFQNRSITVDEDLTVDANWRRTGFVSTI